MSRWLTGFVIADLKLSLLAEPSASSPGAPGYRAQPALTARAPLVPGCRRCSFVFGAGKKRLRGLPDRIELFPLGTLEELPVLMRVPELGPDESVARTQRAEASGGAAASR